MKQRIARCAVIVALGVTGESQWLEAAPTECYTIRPGDTAAQIARRLTGDAERRYEPWFQIVDPAASRVIPKAGYGRILPGWRACIAVRWVTAEPVLEGDRGTRAARRGRTLSADLSRTLAAVDVTVVWCAVLALLVAMVAWRLAGRYWNDRRAVVTLMTRFGERFIREFERPLSRRGASEPAVRSRLRAMPHRGRVDILLAPNEGRRYPNLSDHKTNVEYDVGRVFQLLTDEPFVGGRPYTRGRWVVVPCRLRAGAAQGGVW